MRKRNWLVPVSVAGIVGSGLWVHLLLQGLAPDTPLDPSRPDYLVNDLRLTEMTPEGIPARILEAGALRHYSRGDLTEADAPLVHLYRDGLAEWHIRGDSGRLVQNHTELYLDGDVRIDRDTASGAEPVSIITRDLRILHGEGYAETEAVTVIENPRHRIEGVGLRAWLNGPVRVKLLEHVRGRHEI